MTLGVAHLHALNIIHRDIKLDNFLLGGPLGTIVKLGDFGLAKYMPLFFKAFSAEVGTPPYMSPEMLTGAGYGSKSDVWSLGCAIHVLVCSTYPYSIGRRDEDAMKTAIRTDIPNLSLTWADACDGSLSFIKCMLDRRPQSRHSAGQIASRLSVGQPCIISQRTLREARRVQKLSSTGERKGMIGVQERWFSSIGSEEERPAVTKANPCKASAKPCELVNTQSTTADSMSDVTS
eukprot:TRINITY_DN12575_c0_g1_i1.p1 TRINITY_DN12575_c0_g1~~TRINITY_DN12575_c0_g1_i1.p1  ORF type:complete len:250 (+),score=18.31 TRINITY_DN12575_c0_g1_i1:51-752(+)